MKDALDLCDSRFIFSGTVNELPKEPMNSEMVFIVGTKDAYMYIDGECVLTGVLDEEDNTKNEDIAYTNCPNCGAPVDKYSDKCPYCSTIYIRNSKR